MLIVVLGVNQEHVQSRHLLHMVVLLVASWSSIKLAVRIPVHRIVLWKHGLLGHHAASSVMEESNFAPEESKLHHCMVVLHVDTRRSPNLVSHRRAQLHAKLVNGLLGIAVQHSVGEDPKSVPDQSQSSQRMEGLPALISKRRGFVHLSLVPLGAKSSQLAAVLRLSSQSMEQLVATIC